MHISNLLIVILAASYQIEIRSNKHTTCKTTSQRSLSPREQLFPSFLFEIEDPSIIKVDIRNSLASKDNQIVLEELTRMISSFPGSLLTEIEVDLLPNKGMNIERENWIKPMLVVSSPSEHYNLISLLRVVNSIIRSRFRDISSCCNNLPLILLEIKLPKILEKFSLTFSYSSITSKSQEVVVYLDKSMSPPLFWYLIWVVSVDKGMPLKFFMH